MNQRVLLWAVAAIVAVIVVFNTFFVVDQVSQAVVVRLGQPVGVINPPTNYNPGLKAKIPLLDNVLFFDKRNQLVEVPQEEVITLDNERLVVDAFVRYRIKDPLLYYRTLHDESTAKQRLEPMITSSLRQVLGSSKINEIIADKRAAVMARTLADVRVRAGLSKFGIEVIDLRIKRVDLPAQNQQAVYRRMQTAMQQQAAQNRAVGEQHKREILASANKEVTITLATASQQAGQITGEGDSRAAEIFAASYGKDPSFAAFYRSMAAYQNAFSNGETTMVLSPDSDFFKYFKQGPNAR